jgi:hypothetical protein
MYTAMATLSCARKSLLAVTPAAVLLANAIQFRSLNHAMKNASDEVLARLRKARNSPSRRASIGNKLRGGTKDA